MSTNNHDNPAQAPERPKPFSFDIETGWMRTPAGGVFAQETPGDNHAATIAKLLNLRESQLFEAIRTLSAENAQLKRECNPSKYGPHTLGWLFVHLGGYLVSAFDSDMPGQMSAVQLATVLYDLAVNGKPSNINPQSVNHEQTPPRQDAQAADRAFHEAGSPSDSPLSKSGDRTS